MRRMNVVVKTILSADGPRKIEIFRRPDGSYGFEGYRFSREPFEHCWIPYGFHGCRADDASIAEREAMERVDWSKVLNGMTGNERLLELDLSGEFDAARAAKDIVKMEQILVRARVDLAPIREIIETL